MSSSDEDAFPVEKEAAMEAIGKMIDSEGLEKLTSSKIRAHLSVCALPFILLPFVLLGSVPRFVSVGFQKRFRQFSEGSGPDNKGNN